MKKIILTIAILVVSFIFKENILYSTLFNGDAQQEQVKEDLRFWNFYYEATIKYIKEHEGFNKGYAYTCPAGYLTIGYGHVIKDNESFPCRLTEAQGDALVRKDFDAALKLAETNTDLTGTQKLAIAHFIFAKGIGSFLRSGLKEAIDNNIPIEEEILKWCYFTKADGKKVKSDYAYNIRKWELDLYNQQPQ